MVLSLSELSWKKVLWAEASGEFNAKSLLSYDETD